MAKLYYQDGTEIPESEYAKAIAEGTAQYQEGAQFELRGSDGEVYTVDGANLQGALQAGMGLRTEGEISVEAQQEAQLSEQQKYRTLGQKWLTYVEGVPSGLTAGLSDVALAKVLGDDYAADVKKRREANSLMSGYSQASGLVGGLAAATFTGGASAAGAAGTGGRILAGLGAPTRAILGAGKAAGGLGRALAGSGRAGRFLGAGFQAATEGALYGMGQEASRAALGGEEITVEKLLAAGGHGALWGAGTAGALGLAAPLARRGGRAALGLLGKAGSLDDLARSQTQRAIGTRSGNVKKFGEESLDMMSDDLLAYELRTGNNAGKKIIRAGRDVKGIADDLATARNEVGEQLSTLKNQVDDITTANPELAPSLSTYLQRVEEKVIAPLAETSTGSGTKLANKIRREIKPVAEAAARGETWSFRQLEAHRNELFHIAKTKGKQLKLSADPIKAVERELNDYLGEVAENALSSTTGGAGKYREAKRLMRSILQADEIAQAELGRAAGRSSMSLVEKGAAVAGAMGTIATGNVGALVGGAATGVANRALSKYGNSTMASMAKAVQKMNLRLDTGVKAAVTGKAPQRLSKAGSGTVGAEAGDLVKTSQKRIEEVQRLSTNPALAVARTDKATGQFDSRDQLKAAAVTRQMAAIEFLAGKMPSQFSRVGNTLTPHLENPQLSLNQAKKFQRYWRGVNDPMSVVDDLAKGEIDQEGIEAIKVVYPKIFEEMRARVIDATQRLEKPLPYSRRIMLGMVFEFPSDRSLDPTYIQRTQAIHAEKPEPPAPKPPSTPSNNSGGKSLLTPSQKLEV